MFSKVLESMIVAPNTTIYSQAVEMGSMNGVDVQG